MWQNEYLSIEGEVFSVYRTLTKNEAMRKINAVLISVEAISKLGRTNFWPLKINNIYNNNLLQIF